MTVKELIALLKKLPQDAPLVLDNEDADYWRVPKFEVWHAPTVDEAWVTSDRRGHMYVVIVRRPKV